MVKLVKILQNIIFMLLFINLIEYFYEEARGLYNFNYNIMILKILTLVTQAS